LPPYPEVNDKVSPAQIEAMDKWSVQQDRSYGYLKVKAEWRVDEIIPSVPRPPRLLE
jgi:hypothetical protein